MSLENMRQWVGRTKAVEDFAAPFPVRALIATFDEQDPDPKIGDPLPPLWHWLYFLPTYRQSQAGPDGHAARGEFLPPVPLPRRMWAGSRLEFLRPLEVGARVKRVSRITEVAPKRGRSGDLVFVTVRHEVSDARGLVLSDEHDIVYRGEGGEKPAAVRPGEASQWEREIHPDPLLLFRYSAVTFNGHRIHYDHPYATRVEGYPGLVVHGPLIATLLVDLLRRNLPEVTLRTYRFRALRPLFDTASFFTCGRPDGANRAAKLWTRDAEGAMTMEAEATW